MTDLPLQWILDRLAEDEATAKAATRCGETWTHNGENEYPWLITGTRAGSAFDSRVIVYDEGVPSTAQADHIATWDPARALATVAALRRVLTEHRPQEYDAQHRAWRARFHPGPFEQCRSCAVWAENDWTGPPGVLWPCPTVRAIASIWADRNGYADWREVWGDE